MNPMTRVCAERDAWKKDAEQHARSADYYRNLIDDAADQIGEMVFRCDDGSISTWVLPAKLPEAVRVLRESKEGWERVARHLQDLLSKTQDALCVALPLDSDGNVDYDHLPAAAKEEVAEVKERLNMRRLGTLGRVASALNVSFSAFEPEQASVEKLLKAIEDLKVLAAAGVGAKTVKELFVGPPTVAVHIDSYRHMWPVYPAPFGTNQDLYVNDLGHLCTKAAERAYNTSTDGEVT